jgi:hypothetical protein
MKNQNEEVVLPTDDKAATFGTVEGWTSRHGRFFGAGVPGERAARYDGSTHSICDACGATCSKYYIKCGACRSKAEVEKHKAREIKEWDGEGGLYSELLDKYYFDLDDLYCDLRDEPFTLEDHMLRICEPQYARQIDYDFNCDELPEDGEDPPEVVAAAKAYNEAVKGVILSWLPGKYACKLDDRLKKLEAQALEDREDDE